jgi:hypothetical protein
MRTEPRIHQATEGKHSGKWIISMFQSLDANRNNGSRSRDANRVRSDVLYWMGTNWTKIADDAKAFDTREDAEEDGELAARR